jgi:SAM-dependent methyltransferase
MYGRYQYLLNRNPLKKVVYGVLGWPRISDWNRFWRVLRAVEFLHNRPKRILDAGCGIGFYSLALAERFPEAEITAADDDATLIANLKRVTGCGRYRNISPLHADLNIYQPVQQYDLICCVDVLEHIENDVAALERFASWLRPGGYLVMHVPQRLQRFQFIKREEDPSGPHKREGYLPAEICNLLTEHGLTPIRCEPSYGKLAGLAVEMDEMLWKGRLYPVWLALFPVLLLIMKWDVKRSVPEGFGVLITAQRDG